jgi:hypothetical protein
LDIDDPMAVNGRGLPMPLEELIRTGKKIVHPVKDPQDPSREKKLRRFFKEIRDAS